MDIESYIYKVITSDGSGSAFKVEGYNFFITNYHVVEGFFEVALEDNHKNRYLANVIMIDPDMDIAFIYSKDLDSNNSLIKIDSNLEINRMDTLLIYGYPYGMPFTITKGIVSNPKQQIDGKYYIQTDAAINPGNSGGAMVNSDNKLVGIVSSKFSDADNMGFGISYKYLLENIKNYNFDDKKIEYRCNACNSYIDISKNHIKDCPKCGNGIYERVYDKREESFIEEFINSALNKINLSKSLTQVNKNYWEFYYEKCLIRIFSTNRTPDILIATSPICNMPSNIDRNLMIELLSKEKYQPYIIGLSDNKIYLSYRIYVSDLRVKQFRDEIFSNFKEFAIFADKIQKYFIDTYNASLPNESKT